MDNKGLKLGNCLIVMHKNSISMYFYALEQPVTGSKSGSIRPIMNMPPPFNIQENSLEKYSLEDDGYCFNSFKSTPLRGAA